MSVKVKWLTAIKNGGHRWLVVIGLVGVALLALSEWIPQRETSDDDTNTVSVAQLEAALEQRVTDLVAGVSGVGTCRVMITLERGVQTVYAADTSDSSSTEAQSQQQSILAVDTDSGPLGLPVAELQPTVKGVAVVCQGGDDPTVCQRVVDLISTALHISDRRVYVAKSALD